METVIACRAWLADGGDIWNLYGPTEATIAFTGARVTGSERPSGNASIGLPFGRNEIAVLADEVLHRELVDELEGELLLAGPQVFAGYTTDAPSPFLDADGTRWYHSGDLVRIDHEGVYFRGRLDSQVKYRGYRIELGEIESAIRRTYGLNTVAVVLTGEGAMAEIMAFYLVHEAIGDIEPAALHESIPSYMIPGSFVGLERMPTNPNNKIDRRALLAWQG
jgi:acyl-coenzyme A synthetase/AMP-(fatty) acid ligase